MGLSDSFSEPKHLHPQISGDGHLSQSASIPGSGQSTRFDSLEVYLVSYQTSLNMTISQGTGLLTQESGSTVKHINWVIDPCISPGNYNVRISSSILCVDHTLLLIQFYWPLLGFFLVSTFSAPSSVVILEADSKFFFAIAYLL